MNILIVTLLLCFVVFTTALVKLHIRPHVAPSSMFAFNVLYFASIACALSVWLMNPSYSEMGVFVSVVFLVSMALFQSSLEDIVAFVIVYLRQLYKVGDLLKVGDVNGQITHMNLLGATLENHFTKMKITLPHHTIYKQYAHI